MKSEVDQAELLRHEVDPKIRYLVQGGVYCGLETGVRGF